MTDKSKITDFNEAKKRVGAQKKDKSQLNGGGYDDAVRKQRGHQKKYLSSSAGIRWFHYLQLFLLLGLVVWLMKSCGFS